jgi:hypothetical protein
MVLHMTIRRLLVKASQASLASRSLPEFDEQFGLTVEGKQFESLSRSDAQRTEVTLIECKDFSGTMPFGQDNDRSIG